MARREARDLEVVPHQPVGRRQRVIASAEVLLLVIVGRSPCQYRGDVERLSRDLRPHVFRPHAFGRVLVVRASGGVDVVISGEVAVAGGIDPAGELDGQLLGTGHRDPPRLGDVFRAAGNRDAECAGRQADALAVRAVDLRLEEEVGRQTLGDVRIDAFLIVAHEETGRRRLPVLVLHAQADGMRRRRGEQHLDVVAEADILRALADAESEDRGSLPGVAAVDLQDRVLDRESREARAHRRPVDRSRSPPSVRVLAPR